MFCDWDRFFFIQFMIWVKTVSKGYQQKTEAGIEINIILGTDVTFEFSLHLSDN